MRALLIPAVSLLLGSRLIAQNASNLDVKGILASLQQIKQKQTDSAKSQLVQTISDFTAASADDGSALNFYVEAIRVTRFVGQANEATAFGEWKKNQLPRLNPAAIRTALRYTVLSLQRAAGGTDEQMFPVLLAYAQDTQAILASLSNPDNAQQRPPGERGQRGFGERAAGGDAGERIMGQDVSQNIFSRWYNIGGKLSGLDNWENVPENIDGMYQKLLLPMMRKNRDPRILRYWDDKILMEKGAAASATAAFSTDRFNLTRRPSLLWGRAEDEVAIGMHDQGITDMYNLVKAFPDHPDAGKWIEELKGLLTAPPAVAAASGPAPVAAH